MTTAMGWNCHLWYVDNKQKPKNYDDYDHVIIITHRLLFLSLRDLSVDLFPTISVPVSFKTTNKKKEEEESKLVLMDWPGCI